MATGRVKWFNDVKGYGFITVNGRSEGKGNDVFVHFSQIEMDGRKTLLEGQQVEFEIGHTPRGDQAERVTVLE